MTQNGPDLSALARDMLKWEAMRRELDLLEQAIKDTVAQLGKTQTVGNVRATYSSGRKSYDYQAAIQAAGFGPQYWTPRPTEYDWKLTAEQLGITDILFTQSPPSVAIKLLE